MCEQKEYAIAQVIVFGAFVFCCAGNVAAQMGMSAVETSERAAVEPVDPEAVPRPSLRALRMNTPIDLNGTLDEAIWLRADTGWGFVQDLPRAGYPMSERTVVRVLYDDENLYIGATMYDSEPERRNSPGLEQDFPTQDSDLIDGNVINVTYTNNFERLIDVTRISGVDVAAGDYDFNEVAVTYRPTGARVLSGLLRVSRGDFFDGDRTSVTANALFRPNYHLAITASAQHNDVALAGTSFTTDVYGARVRYAYNTRLFALAFVQFNDSSDELVANFRVNIIHAPLSDIFFVVTERRYVGNDGLRADLLERTVSAKATKLFAF